MDSITINCPQFGLKKTLFWKNRVVDSNAREPAFAALVYTLAATASQISSCLQRDLFYLKKGFYVNNYGREQLFN